MAQKEKVCAISDNLMLFLAIIIISLNKIQLNDLVILTKIHIFVCVCFNQVYLNLIRTALWI